MQSGRTLVGEVAKAFFGYAVSLDQILDLVVDL